MPHTIKRLTLIAGIFTTGSFFLCCLSGTIGWLNVYWAVIFALIACGFFLLVACSTAVNLLSSQQNAGAHRDGAALPRFVQTFQESVLGKNVQLAVSIAILVAAHAFILANTVSPSENLLSNHDQGMYLAAAAHLKTEGRHAMATNWIRQSPAKYKRFFTKEISPSLKTASPSEKTDTGTQIGFYLMDDVGSSQYIQFPPGYPTLLAVFWSLGGYDLVAYSNVLLCLLCGLMLAAVCRNFIGRSGTLATWLLFLFCPLTLWSANHLYAEPALLLLWLFALWALSFSKEYPTLSGTLAALSIGAAFLVKIDALPLFVVPLVYAAFISKDNSLRFRATFLALSIATGILSTGLYMHYAKPYFEFTLSGLFSGHLFVVTVCIVLLLAVISGIPKIRLEAYRLVKANSRLLRHSLVVSISLILLYFYYVRPHVAEPHLIFTDESGTPTESLREQTFYRLGWYFTPLGLALASAGLTAALIKRIHPVQLAFTGIATLFLLYYSYDIHCTPYQPYAMRRLFPFVVPALCFGIPFLIQNIPIERYSVITKVSLTLLITSALLYQFQQISQKRILRENYKGLYEYLSSVSQELPDNQHILVNGKGQACVYAAPLRYIFGKECILLYPDYRDRNYHETIRHFTQDGTGSAYVLSTSPNDRMSLRAEILSTQKLSDTLETTYAGTTTTDCPDNDIKIFRLSLYLTELDLP